MAYSLLRRTGQFRIADTEKVKDMSSSPDQSTTPHIEAASTLRWQRRFLIALTVLAWIVTAGLIFWGIGLIIEPVILLPEEHKSKASGSKPSLDEHEQTVVKT
jgi:hypothetical protein